MQAHEIEELDCHWSDGGNVEYWNECEGLWYAFDPLSEQWHIEEGAFGNWDKIEDPKNAMSASIRAWADTYSDERELAMET